MPLKLLIISGLWAVLAFLPYSFLTYMPRVPSRHTYLASVALAWIVAAGLLALRSRWRARPQLIVTVVLAVVCHNYGYLWIKKQRQFAERAAPTQDLVRFSQQNTGPIYIKCFPYGAEIAELALLIAANDSPTRLRWARPPECSGYRYERASVEAAASGVVSVRAAAPSSP
jgi:hypothetical protein